MPLITFNHLFSQFQAGQSLFIAGSSAEPRPLVEALKAQAADLPALEIINSFVPGVNTLPLIADNNQLTETAIFPRPTLCENKAAGSQRITLIPHSYYGCHQYLAERSIDWVFVQVSPPDDQGRCCLGPSVELLPSAINNAKNLIGLINPQVPVIRGSQFINVNAFSFCCEIDAPLMDYDAGDTDHSSKQIAQHLATLIDDGSTLQTGLGKVPAQLLNQLSDRKNLRFHTGLLTDGIFDLLAAGALDTAQTHLSCASLGSAGFYQQLKELDFLTIAGVKQTHKPDTLQAIDKLISINSALQIDLSGQTNLEYLGTRKISSAGGAPDFATAASQSPNGNSVIVLPATASDGKVSRIVPSLNSAVPASLETQQIDTVVSEYGIANLRCKSPTERAEALIAVAAPDFRMDLEKSLK